MTRHALVLVFAVASLTGCNCSRQHVTTVNSELTANKTSLDFGDVWVDTDSTLSVTLTNPSLDPVHLLSVALEEGGSPAFTVAPDGDTVPAGGMLNVQVTFHPMDEGVMQAVLRIDSDATTGATTEITLTGRGVARSIITVQPAAIDFGDVLYQTTKTVPLMVSNDGSKAFDLSAAALSPGSPFAFTLPPKAIVEAQGGQVVIQVSFTPVAAGAPTDVLTLDPMDPASVAIPLKGRSEPKLHVNPTSIDFGTVDPSAKRLVGLTFTNDGFAPLHLGAALSPLTDASFGLELMGSSVNPYQVTLAPNATKTVEVTFHPTMPSSTFTGAVDLSSDDPDQPSLTIPLTGKSGMVQPCTTNVAFDGEVLAVDVGPQSIYYVGSFTTYNTVSSPRVAKTDLNCTLDPTFNVGAGFDQAPNYVAATSDGDVVVGTSATFPRYNNSPDQRATWKLKSDGTVNASWNPPNPMAAAGDNQMLDIHAMDNMVTVNTWQSIRVLDLNGQPLFTGTGGVNLHELFPIAGRKAILLSRGDAPFNGNNNPGGIKLLDFSAVSTDPTFGRIDPTFAGNAGTGADASCGQMPAVSPDGTHFVAACTTRWSGTDYAWNGGPNSGHPIFAINMDGTAVSPWAPDIQSSNDDGAYPCGIDSMNRIYLVGPVTSISGVSVSPSRLYRLKPDGSYDTSFGTFNGNVNGCRVLSDDRILTYGAFSQYGSAPAGRVAFLHADGTKY
jgi:hypothetical protein